ncbi:MAG TPA: nucleotidyltransferase family protein [Kiritimatiellia bacterium]|nr:nucleotidyltransferase family protein [Kiritimatiellia bacterium]
MKLPLSEVGISKAATIRDAMSKLSDLGALRPNNTLVVVDDEGVLAGTVTDGDIRRAFLRGATMDSKLGDICRRDPIVAPESMPVDSVHRLMQMNEVVSIPLVDNARKVVAVEMLGARRVAAAELMAVVMAGGEGVRLRPLTENMPKPMLKVGGKPILQTILEALRRGGFTRILLNVRYLAPIIEDYFKDGSEFDLKISYIHEPKPMGTAGSIGLIPDAQRPQAPFLVINGDLLTTLNFRAFYDFHMAADYDFTLCGRPYEVKIPFGYPVISGDVVTEFREKPVFTHLVNSGIYCMSHQLIGEVPVGEYFDMPDVIRRAIKLGMRVGVFPLREDFHEIGRPESYTAAEEFYRKHLSIFSPSEAI